MKFQENPFAGFSHMNIVGKIYCSFFLERKSYCEPQYYATIYHSFFLLPSNKAMQKKDDGVFASNTLWKQVPFCLFPPRRNMLT